MSSSTMATMRLLIHVAGQSDLLLRVKDAQSDPGRQQTSAQMQEPIVVISADANATHQSVIRVMEASRLAGLAQITFTTQSNK